MQEILDQIKPLWDQWEPVAEVLTLMALLFAAVAAWRSASAASRAAVATRVAAAAQIMSNLLNEYGSDEMLDAMTRLRKFEERHGHQFHHRFLELRGEDRESYNSLNAMRRRVTHFFHKIYLLQKAGYIDDAFVRTVAGQGMGEFFVEVNEPLEKILAPDYDDSAFEYFAKLHGVDRRVAELLFPKEAAEVKGEVTSQMTRVSPEDQ